MRFWDLLLLGGMITWVACVFLRAVAACAQHMRGEVAAQIEAVLAEHEEQQSHGEEDPLAAEPEEPITAEAAIKPASRPKRPRSANGNGRNGHGRTSGRPNSRLGGRRRP